MTIAMKRKSCVFCGSETFNNVLTSDKKYDNIVLSLVFEHLFKKMLKLLNGKKEDMIKNVNFEEIFI